MALAGKLTTVGTLSGRLGSNASGTAVIGSIQRSDTAPYYRGEYEVTPQAYEQSLDTRGLRMTGDIVINEIPYYETTNESGGYTVIIGG